MSFFGRLALGANLIDETGKRYGSLTVLRLAPASGRDARWLCLCDCGAEHYALGRNLRNGHTSRCSACVAAIHAEAHAARSVERKRTFVGCRCTFCGVTGHRMYDCKARRAARAFKPVVCSVCGDLPHRVVGPKCRRCGLRFAPEEHVAVPAPTGGSWWWLGGAE